MGLGDERKGERPFFPAVSEREAGGNIMETKVLGQMAEGGRQKHQILP